MAPEFVLHTAHPTYPETPREMWLDNLFNHLVIDKWQQTDIFSGVAGPGEGLAAADPGLRWGGCSSGGGAAAPTSQLARCPMSGTPFIPRIALALAAVSPSAAAADRPAHQLSHLRLANPASNSLAVPTAPG